MAHRSISEVEPASSGEAGQGPCGLIPAWIRGSCDSRVLIRASIHIGPRIHISAREQSDLRRHLFSKKRYARSIKKWLFEKTTLCLIFVSVVKELFAGKLRSTADSNSGGLKDDGYEEDAESGPEYPQNFSFNLARWVLTFHKRTRPSCGSSASAAIVQRVAGRAARFRFQHRDMEDPYPRSEERRVGKECVP